MNDQTKGKTNDKPIGLPGDCTIHIRHYKFVMVVPVVQCTFSFCCTLYMHVWISMDMYGHTCKVHVAMVQMKQDVTVDSDRVKCKLSFMQTSFDNNSRKKSIIQGYHRVQHNIYRCYTQSN